MPPRSAACISPRSTRHRKRRSSMPCASRGHQSCRSSPSTRTSSSATYCFRRLRSTERIARCSDWLRWPCGRNGSGRGSVRRWFARGSRPAGAAARRPWSLSATPPSIRDSASCRRLASACAASTTCRTRCSWRWNWFLRPPGRESRKGGKGRPGPVSPGVRRPVSRYFLPVICSRIASSWRRSSGVNSAPKSSASKTGRISISVLAVERVGQRFTHSTASSIDFTFHSQKPAMSSLVSANGPSMTVRLPPENRTRLPFDARVQALAGQHDAGLHQLLVVLAHRRQQLLVSGITPGFRFLARLHDHHDSHSVAPLNISPSCPGRTGTPEIDIPGYMISHLAHIQ